MWQNVADYNDAVARHRERHPQSLGMAKMLYDAMRAVDVLASLADVDAKNIGAVGHSLGTKETLYLAAFDERIKAAVASEGEVASVRRTGTRRGISARRSATRNSRSIIISSWPSIAPRPFLILGGESGHGASDGDRRGLIEAALPVWRLYGEPARLGLMNHRKGHSIPPPQAEYMAEWLKTYLR